MGWQSPVQEVTVPYRGKNTEAWIYWLNEFEVELRVVSRTPGPIRKVEHLEPDGSWAWNEEYEIIPAAKIWPVEPLIEKGIITPLIPGIHVHGGSIDQCHRCGYTGQQRWLDEKKGFEMPCPGWLYGGGVG